MNRMVDELTALAAHIDQTLGSAVRDGDIRALDDTELLGVLRLAAQVQRQLDAVLVDAVGEVDARSQSGWREERLTSRLGCHDVCELVERVTRLSRTSAARYRKAADAVRPDASVTTGELLDPPLPALRDALLDGVVGVDGLIAAARPLLAMGARANRDDVLTADGVLAAHARGEAGDGAPPAPADLLGVHAQTWAMFLDQDGAQPREKLAQQHRGLTLGRATEHGTPIHGMLIPEVAAQLQRLFDALLSPKTQVRFTTPDPDTGADAPEGEAGANAPDADASADAPDAVGDAEDGTAGLVSFDERTRAQKQHDALATILTVAAASQQLPTIGGAAPTLVVTVRAEDLLHGTGEGHSAETDAPLPPAALRHIACTGAIQRVTLDVRGRIQGIGTAQRVFNKHQRRAIAARDGSCLIPVCGVPAGWCEIHHVIDHALGGPTHTDNGVLLCWYHHRHLDESGWSIRMRDGVPEVRAPSWIDPTGQWRPATTSKTRLLNTIRRQ